MRILYVTALPLTNRDIERYGINMMLRYGFDITVINVFSLCYPDRNIGKFNNSIDGDVNVDIINVKRIGELNEYVRKTKDCLYSLLLIPYSNTSDEICCFLNMQNISTVRIRVGYIPEAHKSNGAYQRMMSILCHLLDIGDPVVILNKILNKIKIPINKVRKPQIDYLFYGGSVAKDNLPSEYNGTKYKFSVHTLDYDFHLKNDSGQYFNNYILFLDQSIGTVHFDGYLSTGKIPSYKKQFSDIYYEKMNEYFKYLERKYDCNIIVAAHPKTDYIDNDYRFFGRKVLYNKTYSLIRDAKFVVGYSSTSMNFAVMCNKPIVIVYSKTYDRFSSLKNRKDALAFSQSLGVEEINIDHNYTNKEKIKIDKKSYTEHMNSYIKEKDSEDGLFWDVVLEKVMEKAENNHVP